MITLNVKRKDAKTFKSAEISTTFDLMKYYRARDIEKL